MYSMIRKIYRLPVNLVISSAVLMLGLNAIHAGFFINFKYQTILSVVTFLSGVMVILTGGYAFRKVNTTFDPTNPEQAYI